VKVTVTRFEEARARVFANGKRMACDLAPQGMDSPIVFHSVRLAPMFAKDPENNDTDKTLLITEGDGVFEMEGVKTAVFSGDAVWLPKGSTHSLLSGKNGIRYVVVKAK
jgi:mannose-6-phosphate isomerase-like protein (cupin superfamily)